jgi:hypothetical protein
MIVKARQTKLQLLINEVKFFGVKENANIIRYAILPYAG